MTDIDMIYMNMAKEKMKESHCLRRKVGAILVTKDAHYIFKSVNNPIPNKHLCEDKGCLRKFNHIYSGTHIDICRCIHCETDLIVQCALNNISPKDSTIYTTLFPCPICAKIICAAGIKRVVYLKNYSNQHGAEIFKQFNVIVEKMNNS